MNKTCADCIHYEVCDPYVAPNESFPEMKGGCGCFKDKSRFIELPCAVGDTVYVTKPYFSYIQEYEVKGFHLGEFPTLNGHARNPYLICYHKPSGMLKHISISDFGKTAFFSKDEAKKALKGGAK